nr:hypothetical protein DWF04_05245 [Cereibacter sphaeroides f. sp. denitrificans]
MDALEAMSDGRPRFGDRPVPGRIIGSHRHGLRWDDAPGEGNATQTLHNRRAHWSGAGVLARIILGRTAERQSRYYKGRCCSRAPNGTTWVVPARPSRVSLSLPAIVRVPSASGRRSRPAR